MNIQELKQGDTIYYVSDYPIFRIRHVKYLCVHPMGGGNYHILIDECEDPFRIHKSKLLSILGQGCKTRKDAAILIANRHQEQAEYYRIKEANM